MKFKIHNKEVLSDHFFKLDAYELEHERFDGGSLSIRREHLERGNAVAALLYDPNYDEVLLIEQFRIGPAIRNDEAWLIEVVAGMIDEGEDKETAAKREAVEESGYEPTELVHLGNYYSTPGGSSETIDLYLGYVNKDKPIAEGGGMDHEHEDIRSFWLTRQEAVTWVKNGKINSGGPMLAIMLAFGFDGVVKK